VCARKNRSQRERERERERLCVFDRGTGGSVIFFILIIVLSYS
jgi:hypothetical protein